MVIKVEASQTQCLSILIKHNFAKHERAY
jgi:hypothetical protein